MDHHSVGPGLTRVHAEALGALEAGGIGSTTVSTEGAGFVDTWDGVTVDVTATLFRTGSCGTAETGNGNLLFRLGRDGGRLGVGAVGVGVVVVVHLGC